MATSRIARAGRAVAIAAFSLTTMTGFWQPSTPLKDIATAERVEIVFRPDADLDYLYEVRQALAERDVSLEYTSIIFDEAGKLVDIGIRVKQGDTERGTSAPELSESKGVYLLVEFGVG